MIKKYLQFIKESNYQGFNSFGEWVESLIKDEYIKNIVFRFTKDIDFDINLSNALNTLDEKVQQDIKQQIDEYLQNGIQEKEPTIIATTDIVTEAVEISPSGKGVFTSFLKSLTGLGQKESQPNFEKCPDSFLIFYHYPNLNSDNVKQVFSRFKSLTRHLDVIDYGKNEVDLYFGIKCDGQFEYGVMYDNFIPIGRFKLSTGIIKWIIQIDSKSAHSLKKILVNLSYSDIITLGKIKMDMLNYNPGYHESRMKPTINDRIISFGFHGAGKWENGKLDPDQFLAIKKNFTTWLLSKKWGNKVLISVDPKSFWLYLHLKLK